MANTNENLNEQRPSTHDKIIDLLQHMSAQGFEYHTNMAAANYLFAHSKFDKNKDETCIPVDKFNNIMQDQRNNESATSLNNKVELLSQNLGMEEHNIQGVPYYIIPHKKFKELESGKGSAKEILTHKLFKSYVRFDDHDFAYSVDSQSAMNLSPRYFKVLVDFVDNVCNGDWTKVTFDDQLQDMNSPWGITDTKPTLKLKFAPELFGETKKQVEETLEKYFDKGWREYIVIKNDEVVVDPKYVVRLSNPVGYAEKYDSTKPLIEGAKEFRMDRAAASSAQRTSNKPAHDQILDIITDVIAHDGDKTLNLKSIAIDTNGKTLIKASELNAKLDANDKTNNKIKLLEEGLGMKQEQRYGVKYYVIDQKKFESLENGTGKAEEVTKHALFKAYVTHYAWKEADAQEHANALSLKDYQRTVELINNASGEDWSKVHFIKDGDKYTLAFDQRRFGNSDKDIEAKIDKDFDSRILGRDYLELDRMFNQVEVRQDILDSLLDPTEQINYDKGLKKAIDAQFVNNSGRNRG